MNIREMFSILLCSFAFLMGHQLGLGNVSFWIVLLIAFASGLLTFILLNYEELFRGKKQ